MLDSLLVFDIETIPDTDVCPNLTGFSDPDIESRRRELAEYHLQITDGKNDFLRQPFHKVIVISCLKAEIKRLGGNREQYKFQHLDVSKTHDERELIEQFFKYFAKIRPRIVSFNGRTFDLPVLKYRAMVYGIVVDYLYNSGDKWNNYMQRYQLDWHCDLLEALSDFGASARIKMNEVSSVFGLPGKFDVHGSQVVTMYDDGKIDEIRDYCKTDVLNTYLIYLRYMHHRGNLVNYNSCIDDLIEYLSLQDGKLKEFLHAWDNSCNGQFYL